MRGSQLGVKNQDPQQPESSSGSDCQSSICPVQESGADLFKRLVELADKGHDQKGWQLDELASKAIRYVRSRIAEPIRVDSMARQLGVSPSTLNLVLRKQLTCSTQELITVIKMQEAKRLLNQGDLLIKEVANRLGFEDPYYFSARFKWFFGLSPKDFRRFYQQRALLASAAGNNLAQHSSRSTQSEYAQKQNQPGGNGVEQKEALSPGTTVDRFVVISQIGRGGMGVVYKAFDPKLNRGIALKLIRSDHAKLAQSQNRLLREAQSLARLSHPNVLPVYDVGISDEQVYMAMALIEGKTLKDWLNAQQRSVREILEVLTAAGRGLSAAHQAGLIHRDFSPSNVIVGDDHQIRVLDFGLARERWVEDVTQPARMHSQTMFGVLETDENSCDATRNCYCSSLTIEGDIVGTPSYMAPEQYLGITADQRTDLFSFCVVLYEALCKKRPFAGNSLTALECRTIQQQIEPPCGESKIPDHLWQSIRKGLRSDPNDRYQSMDSLLNDLNKEPCDLDRQARWGQRKVWVAFGFLLFSTLLCIAVYFGMRHPEQAFCESQEAEMARVWDDKTRASIQKAFLARESTAGQGMWQLVDRNISRYLTKWKQAHAAVCNAKQIGNPLTKDRVDTQLHCLQKRKRDLQALVRVWANAETLVAYQAVEATAALASIAGCADRKPQYTHNPPPPAAEQKIQVASMRDDLADVEAFFKTGRYQHGLELSQRLLREAKTVAYDPLLAEVLYWRGRLLSRSGDYTQAEVTLYDAARVAGKSNDGLLMLKSISCIVWIVGIRQARYAEALSLGRTAEAMLGFIGEDERVMGRLLASLGAILEEQGDYTRALAYQRRSQKTFEKLYGSEHPAIVPVLINLGSLYLRLGEWQNALEYYKKSLKIREKWFGLEHPQTSTALYNIGNVLLRQGEYQNALTYFRKSLATEKKALGVNHPYVAYSLCGIGKLLMFQGEYAKARQYFSRAKIIWEKSLAPEHPLVAVPMVYIGNSYVLQNRAEQGLLLLERAVRLCEKATCDVEAHGMGLFALARALESSGGAFTRAIELGKRARHRYQISPKAFHKEIEEVNIWLTTLGAN